MPVLSDPLFPYTAAAVRVEAWDPLPGLRLVAGTPEDVRAEVRRDGLRGWLAVLGKQGQR